MWAGVGVTDHALAGVVDEEGVRPEAVGDPSRHLARWGRLLFEGDGGAGHIRRVDRHHSVRVRLRRHAHSRHRRPFFVGAIAHEPSSNRQIIPLSWKYGNRSGYHLSWRACPPQATPGVPYAGTGGGDGYGRWRHRQTPGRSTQQPVGQSQCSDPRGPGPLPPARPIDHLHRRIRSDAGAPGLPRGGLLQRRAGDLLAAR